MRTRHVVTSKAAPDRRRPKTARHRDRAHRRSRGAPHRTDRRVIRGLAGTRSLLARLRLQRLWLGPRRPQRLLRLRTRRPVRPAPPRPWPLSPRASGPRPGRSRSADDRNGSQPAQEDHAGPRRQPDRRALRRRSRAGDLHRWKRAVLPGRLGRDRPRHAQRPGHDAARRTSVGVLGRTIGRGDRARRGQDLRHGNLKVLFQNTNINPMTGEEAYGPGGALLGDLVKFPFGGSPTIKAAFGPFEAANNPDGGAGTAVELGVESAIDSDPYSFVPYHGGTVVADAAGNDLLFVSRSGKIRCSRVPDDSRDGAARLPRTDADRRPCPSAPRPCPTRSPSARTARCTSASSAARLSTKARRTSIASFQVGADRVRERLHRDRRHRLRPLGTAAGPGDRPEGPHRPGALKAKGSRHPGRSSACTKTDSTACSPRRASSSRRAWQSDMTARSTCRTSECCRRPADPVA